ncbi:AfsR/SARP family transcriptional regulator [Streptomyces sp. M19]
MCCTDTWPGCAPPFVPWRALRGTGGGQSRPQVRWLRTRHRPRARRPPPLPRAGRRRRRDPEGDERVVALLREAVELWRGEALAGLSGDWVETTRARIDGERLAAQLALGEAGLRLGLHGELLAELRGLADAHPLDERVVRQLIQALHQCELRAAALEEYERTRIRLAEELGVDPGPELQALHRRILLGDQRPAGRDGAPAGARGRPGDSGAPETLAAGAPGSTAARAWSLPNCRAPYRASAAGPTPSPGCTPWCRRSGSRTAPGPW